MCGHGDGTRPHTAPMSLPPRVLRDSAKKIAELQKKMSLGPCLFSGEARVASAWLGKSGATRHRSVLSLVISSKDAVAPWLAFLPCTVPPSFLIHPRHADFFNLCSPSLETMSPSNAHTHPSYIRSAKHYHPLTAVTVTHWSSFLRPLPPSIHT